MLLSSFTSPISGFSKLARFFTALSVLAFLSACQFQPLHGSSSGTLNGGNDRLAAVEVSAASTRVGQQLRNHLVFLFTGGRQVPEKTHEAIIRVSSANRTLASIPDPAVQNTTAGTVTVTASYDLIDKSTGESIGNGSRNASASYDITGQSFANLRAVRDAENRAAKEAAEALRLAIAGDLGRT